MPIREAAAALQERISKASKNSALAAPAVTLLGASKGQPAAAIEEAFHAGIRNFGENRVQEALEKWPALRLSHPGIVLHLIGPLQSNKAKEALGLFDVIQTVDRQKLADALADAMIKTDRKIPCFIQVNTGNEPQKAGVAVSEADRLIDYCQGILPVAGLMCIPPADQPAAPHFALLRQIAQKHGINGLSMGMSEDFETAVRLGSTCVRLGRALFGERS